MRKLSVLILGMLTQLAIAGELDVPHTFTSGTTAVAAEVNDNFNAAKAAVDDNDTRITANTNDVTDLLSRSWQISGLDLYFDSGNVGIGTTPAVGTLELLNPGNSGAERILSAWSPNEVTGAFSGSIFFGDSDNPLEAGHLAFIDSPNDGQEIISFAIHSAGILMAIQGDGDVGIGVLNPSFPLEMANGAYVSAGGVWTDASSREFKENIQELTYDEAQDALSALNPTKFSYKRDRHEDYLGFIAEDVPDLVATNDRRGLSPMDIVAVLTKVVQHQQQEIAALKASLDAESSD